jgi:hypothetical protein
MPVAIHDQALPRPLPVPDHARHRGYHRRYEVHARGGRCQLQQVRVHIRYLCGGERVADYRQTYSEFFRFERDDASLVDTHDFDLARDGWRQSVIVGLVRRHRAEGTALPTGEAELDVRKQFSIAPGDVRGDAGAELRPGATFGLLRDGPGGPSRTRLTIARGDGLPVVIDDLPSCPPGYPVQGTGSFATSRGGRAFEHYRFRFANLTGRFADRGGYHPIRIA